MKITFSKSIICLSLISGGLLSALNCSSSTIMGEPFYSPKSKELYNELLEISKETNWTNLNSLVPEEMKKKYEIKEEENDLLVGAKLIINELYDDEELWEKGIKVGTRINSLVEVRIPLLAYLSLNEIAGIDHVEIN
jgi:hypothetical protein